MVTPIFTTKNFTFQEKSDVGINNTPFTALEVISKHLASKYGIFINFRAFNDEFVGNPVQIVYDGVYVSHDPRGCIDTLEETSEMLFVMHEALVFAEIVWNYIKGSKWEHKLYET